MRRNILFFLLGSFIFGTIGVYAGRTYLASDITYIKSNNTSVSLDSALDELYSSTNLETFNVPSAITPTTSEQEFETQGKKMSGNFKVGAIPSSYKDIHDSTITQASDVLSGKIAYTSSGTKITGTRSECFHSSFICNSTCANGTYNFLDFKPSFFIITLKTNNSRSGHIYFSDIGFLSFENSSGEIPGAGSINYRGSTYKYYTVGNNYVNLNSFGSGWLNKTVYYTACK